MNPGDAFAYCQQKAMPPGSGIYYSFLYIDNETRQKLVGLHAFSTELDDIITGCSDPGVARVKLGWWYEELHRLHDNHPRHPVSTALGLFFSLDELTNLLIPLIKHCESRIAFRQPDNYEQLMAWMSEGPGLLWDKTAELSGFSSSETPEIIKRTGCRIGYFEILQNLVLHLQGQRYFYPRIESDTYGQTQSLYQLQIDRIQAEISSLLEAVPTADRQSQLPALIMGRLVCRTCDEIRRNGYRLADCQVILTPLRKLWVAWRTRQTV